MRQHPTPPISQALRIDEGRPEFISERQFWRRIEAWQAASARRREHALQVVEEADRHLHTLRADLAACPEAKARLDPYGERWFELLHVGSALLELADVDRLFRQGRLCWDKLKLLARVATLVHEAAWIRAALSLDASELAALVARSELGGPPPLSGVLEAADDVGGEDEPVASAGDPDGAALSSTAEPFPVARSVPHLQRGLRRLASRFSARRRSRRWVSARHGARLPAPIPASRPVGSAPNVRRRLRERLSGA